MNITVITEANRTILEGSPSTKLLKSVEDIVDVIGACFEHRSQSLLLYTENLTDRFFDLSSGEAGSILQKLRNYHVRLALVESGSETPYRTAFQQMLTEERKSEDFRVFSDRNTALTWLAHE